MRWLGLSSVFVCASLAVACGGSSAASDGDGLKTGADTGVDDEDTDGTGDDSGTTTPKDSGATTDSSSPPTDTGGTTTSDAADTATGTPTDVAPTTTLRFVAMGDTGKGNDGQKKVGDAVAAKCAKDGCDFVQLLGDNVYDSGVSGVDDPQWTTKFETPYGNVSVPFFAVLGNHDYGGGGTGRELSFSDPFGKGKHQVDYTAKSTKWKMPAKHYFRSVGSVDMLGFDTNMIFWGDAADQKTAVNGWLAAAKGQWKIGFGHHPYLSNGDHGNAGTYEGYSWLPVANGKNVKDFFDANVCGKLDLYIAGHDHSRQWLKPQCKGTELIVSGAGAATTDVVTNRSEFYWQANTVGFLYIVIQGNKLTGEFIDGDGNVEYTRTMTK